MPPAVIRVETPAVRIFDLEERPAVAQGRPSRQIIYLPEIGCEIELLGVQGGTARLGFRAPPSLTIRRSEGDVAIAPPEAWDDPCPDLPDLDIDAIARGAADYTPTQAMLDEDWSDHIPKKGG